MVNIGRECKFQNEPLCELCVIVCDDQPRIWKTESPKVTATNANYSYV